MQTVILLKTYLLICVCKAEPVPSMLRAVGAQIACLSVVPVAHQKPAVSRPGARLLRVFEMRYLAVGCVVVRQRLVWIENSVVVSGHHSSIQD